MADQHVTVDVVFERFPASVRGAVVVRGADREPHQIRLLEASVVEAHAPGRSVETVAVDPVTVDMAPHGEVLVPFDVSFATLEPGWYSMAAEVAVDGSGRARGPESGKRFVVPWPDGEVRRGEVKAGLAITVPGGATATIERIDCRTDRAVVRWSHDPGDPAEFGDLRVMSGTRRLPTLESSHDPGTGSRTTVVHPVLKKVRKLVFEVDHTGRSGRSTQRGKGSASLDLP